MKPAAAPFPWDEIMAFGLGRLGWPPAVFWAASPREVAAALRAQNPGRTGQAPGRSVIEALMAAHPDGPVGPASNLPCEVPHAR
ncbi:MAG: phage tail assembly chaperone [Bosea sp. (in: a-proteobacteria)]|uniref:phage tail assembly chaperone n=1 Tax=Bosea sp. (in: a-proteobacteria) TaxID=1871050 RepID=UPI00273760C9|nr:phage tail assembly chaperone [Bosea sp. (in: a-proteobacteria)]MDP3257598.1 phage tail assembly chaperone [Bosea sp. (in: a-proteobacteria)]MDP3320092.1 phage tail assembly chaperone [Bosea sp. (in: a-proteobacteria)]